MKSRLLAGRNQGRTADNSTTSDDDSRRGDDTKQDVPDVSARWINYQRKRYAGNDYGNRTARMTQSGHQEPARLLELGFLHWQLAPCISLLWRLKGEGNGRKFTKAQVRQRRYRANHAIL